MMKLHIAKNFGLPLDAVTQTFAILAKRGVGKTYTAAVMAEEMLEVGLQVMIIDPIGVWWGLRSSADGKKEGLPIVIFGGDYGDVPLEIAAGQTIADLVVQEGISIVLDLSLFRKGEQARFMTDFCERLYQKNRSPLHIMLDEADAWAPQRPMKGTERLLGAVEDLVRRGRSRGIGITLITQRAAVLNKNVLTQAEVLVALRTIAPQDREAVNAWIEVHGTPEQQKELMSSLPSLPIGTAWFWSPGWLDVFKQVHIRKRKTFDSSATPRVGTKLIPPKKIAPVDLEKIREKISETLERAKAEDPRILRQRIVELERKVKTTSPKVEIKEVPVLTDAHIKWLSNTTEKLVVIAKEFIKGSMTIQQATSVIQKTAENILTMIHPKNIIKQNPVPPIRPLIQTEKTQDLNLRKGAIRILQELTVRHPAGYSRSQVGTLTGFTPSGGTFNTYLGDLRRAEYIEERAGLVYASQKGIHSLGENIPSTPSTHEEVLALWRRALRSGAFRILETVIAAGPKGIIREELAASVGMEITGGTFNTYLGDLRRNGLIIDLNRIITASDILWPGKE